jgi:hypothetical protein
MIRVTVAVHGNMKLAKHGNVAIHVCIFVSYSKLSFLKL